MPIYEYLCRRCNTIFQFLVRKPSSKTAPVCPQCGKGDKMERIMSTFSVKSGSSSIEDMADNPTLAGLATEGTKAMVSAIRRMANEMGEDLGPEVNEALSRLEAGEDPEKIERDLEESGFDMGEGSGSPSHAPGLYEA